MKRSRAAGRPQLGKSKRIGKSISTDPALWARLERFAERHPESASAIACRYILEGLERESNR